MRTLFLTLLLANVAFYAYTQLFHWSLTTDNSTARQINADKLTLITTPIVVSAINKATETAASTTCFSWTGLTHEKLEELKIQLASLNLSVQQNDETVDKTSHWVYIPPRTNLTDARRKTEELKSLGVNDYFVINDGSKWQNAISLGIFSTQAAAKQHLALLQQKGVRSAVESTKTDSIQLISLQINDVNAEQQAGLQSLATKVKEGTLQQINCKTG